MTSKESMEFYALVGPDVARHIAEGGRYNTKKRHTSQAKPCLTRGETVCAH